jgi:hypothetical protein
MAFSRVRIKRGMRAAPGSSPAPVEIRRGYIAYSEYVP